VKHSTGGAALPEGTDERFASASALHDAPLIEERATTRGDHRNGGSNRRPVRSLRGARQRSTPALWRTPTFHARTPAANDAT